MARRMMDEGKRIYTSCVPADMALIGTRFLVFAQEAPSNLTEL